MSLKTAVVGVGALGRHHARILAELPQVDLVAVVDSHEVNGTQVAAACHTKWIADYRELLTQVPDLQAVSIAVPTFAHLEVASTFLQQGIPVLVEKPLASSVPEGEELVRLANEYDTILQVGHIERFNPATQVAWEQVESPKYIRAERVSPYAFRSTDIGAIHDLMIHDLDLVLDLVNAPVKQVDAFGICVLGGHEDSVQARVQFENGCIADITTNRVSPVAKRELQIWSHTGCVTADLHQREVTSYRPSDTLLYGTPVYLRAQQPDSNVSQLKADVFGKFLDVTQHPVSDADALTAELSHFVDCVEQNRRPIVSGEEGLNALVLADQILQSVNQHQWDGHALGPIGPFARLPQEWRRAG